MSIPDEQIAMMQSVTGASASDCAWYLRAANGDIDAACELLYAAPPEQGGAESQRRLPSPHQDHHDDIGQVTPQYASTLSGGADVWSVPPAARQPAAAQRAAPVSRSAPEAPMIDLEAQMRAAQAHLRRLGHTHLLPPEPAARDFGALDGLFAPPNYAASGTLRDACTRAARDNRWVIVNVLGEDFDSGCLNRDVWKNENVHQLVDCYYLLWQAPAGEEATQIASNYRLSSRGFYPPHVFIINPFTRAFVHDIPVKKIKGATKDGTGSFPLKPDKMIDALWKFFEETGLPQDTMQPKDGAARGTPPPAAVATPPPQQHPIEVVDEDDDAELLAALAASEAVAQPQAPTSTPPPTRDIDLTSLCVDPTTPESLRLRIKLPSGPWDLVLPKSLPVKDFADGIRTKLRALGNTSASALSLMVGFPPRKIYDETSGTPSVADLVLGSLTGLRSGDVVTPHF